MNEQAMNIPAQRSSLPVCMATRQGTVLPSTGCVVDEQSTRSVGYYLSFIGKGTSSYEVDLEKVSLTDGQLLFVYPNQLFTHPGYDSAEEYYHIAFDDRTLALLPRQFGFLLNPNHTAVVDFDEATVARVTAAFAILENLLRNPKNARTDTPIFLSYLTSLLTELELAYATTEERPATARMAKFAEFKNAVERRLTEQVSVSDIAGELATSPSTLYGIVKEVAGTSPKEYITNRLMLEAQRRLYLGQPSIKELAYDLGYSDPDYFSRQFKKFTGKSVGQFMESVN
ncbi:helix-turn-helix domain-containing protein [Lewinella sp. IMCC34191]|uniref:helix-turn-helix domain-containing protein n=1 Tax=Lewinella sp. IMCC34191 TaxID=2259172 RepID=UPI0013009822|nr:AraC family transcriptional regulator [Lewinella sp. IMCC34191]